MTNLHTIPEEDDTTSSARSTSIPTIKITVPEVPAQLLKTSKNSSAEAEKIEEGEKTFNDLSTFAPLLTSTADQSSVIEASLDGTAKDEADLDAHPVFKNLKITTSVLEKLKERRPNMFFSEGYWKKAKHKIVLRPPEVTPEDAKALEEIRSMTDLYKKTTTQISVGLAHNYSSRDDSPQKTVSNLHLAIFEMLRWQEEMWALIVTQDKALISMRKALVESMEGQEQLKVKINEILDYLAIADKNADVLHEDVVEAARRIGENEVKIETNKDDINTNATNASETRLDYIKTINEMAQQTNEGFKTLAQRINDNKIEGGAKEDINHLQAQDMLMKQVVQAQGSQLVNIDHKLGLLQSQLQQQSVQVANTQQLKVINVPSSIKIGNATANLVTGDENFACNICKAPFTTVEALQNHIPKHHRDAVNYPVSCQLCTPPRRFKTEHDLLTHSMDKHKEVQINIPASTTEESHDVHHSVLIGGLKIPKTMSNEQTIRESERAQILEKLAPLYAYIQPQHIRFIKRLTDDAKHRHHPYHVQVGFHSQQVRDFILEGAKITKSDVHPFRSIGQIDHSKKMLQKYGEPFLGAGPSAYDPGPLDATRTVTPANLPNNVGGAGGGGPQQGFALAQGLPVVAQPGALSAQTSAMPTYPMTVMMPSLMPTMPWATPLPPPPQPSRGGQRGRGSRGGRGGRRSRIFRN